MKIGLYIENDIVMGTSIPPAENNVEIEVNDPDSIVLGVSKYLDGELINPTLEELEQKRQEEFVATKQIRYENRVVELLRQKYSLDQELAILRQRDDKIEEFTAYSAYAEECKLQAKQEILEVF